MLRHLCYSIFLLFTVLSLSGQSKIELKNPKTQQAPTPSFSQEYGRMNSIKDKPTDKGLDISSFSSIDMSRQSITRLKIKRDPQSGQVIAISGIIPTAKKSLNSEEKGIAYINHSKESFGLDKPSDELSMTETIIDDKGRIHNRYQQHYQGIKLLDTEIMTHEENQLVYFATGRLSKTPTGIDINASISEQEAKKIVISDLDDFQVVPAKLSRLVGGEQIKVEQVIVSSGESYRLAWHIDIYESISDRWEYTIDAQTGEILDKHSTVCHFHGPESEIFDGKTSSTAIDLLGQRRNINVYECGGAYFLADAARTMFYGDESDCTNDDLLINGVIITYDALGNSPQKPGSFRYDYSISNDLNVWNDPRAISAHFNGGSAYEYFKNTFGRESINGDRGNIESFYNVTEDNGQQMDNAFWTGAAIFYGNGNQAFVRPLSAGLDVAGHEMSHGVIQTSANLRYEGESGALNEHFADVFGTMIERDTWQIGEDVVNTQLFPTGALRNMADPNNGGSRVGDPGYQPASVSQQFRGPEDNGGVHINSGIPNHAYYLFAINDNVGIEIAEQVYYKVLTQYLTPRSQFIDLRAAVIQVASQDYGASVATAAAAAFDQVGIVGNDGVIRSEVEATELETNPGTDLILWSGINFDVLNHVTNTGNNTQINIPRVHISKPSITDDGRFVVFVNEQTKIQVLEMDWTSGTVANDFLLFEDDSNFRNAIISKDGTKVAALIGDISSGEADNRLFVIDFSSGDSRVESYELYNPTFSAGVTSGSVLYADAMEFDHSGENIVYDAFNSLAGNEGRDVSYWDIGIIKVWDNVTDDFEPKGDNIFKVFSGLAENISIGNPTFSKTSPDIIAFDLREIMITANADQDATYEVLGANLKSGDVEVLFENNTWGYPNYSSDDTEMIFSVLNNGTDEILGKIGVNSDRISSNGSATVMVQDAFWGVWFGTGIRDLISDTEDILYNELDVYPNPVYDELEIKIPSDITGEGVIELYDINGQLALSQIIAKGQSQSTLNLSQSESGTYMLKISGSESIYSQKIILMK